MKIKVAYTPDEALLATLIDQVIGNVLTESRRNEYAENAVGYRHIYYQTKKPDDLKRLLKAQKPQKRKNRHNKPKTDRNNKTRAETKGKRRGTAV